MRRTVFWSAILALLLPIVQCQDQGKMSLEGQADVAIYSDRGVWSESVRAAGKMFPWMGYTVERVNAEEIKNGVLENFQILCVPGGNMYQYAEDLSSKGIDHIRDFIHGGGGYVGICGGAYFAGERVIWRGDQLPMMSLNLFPSTAQGPYDEIIPYPDSGMCKVIIVDSTHPITQTEPDSAWMLYYWGPALIPENVADVTILGRYDITDQPMMLALEYGRGRAFLIGTHPEIEEDSDRDDVTFGDEFDDRGSDWDLMRKATLWCSGE